MRLSKDASSYKAIGLKKRYAAEQPPSHRSQKNTRKWCRGKVGTHHNLLMVSFDRWFWDWNDTREYLFVTWQCSKCSKKFYESHQRAT